jgi:hypothetical protein
MNSSGRSSILRFRVIGCGCETGRPLGGAHGLSITRDRQAARIAWQPIGTLPEQDSLLFSFALNGTDANNRVAINTILFPHDPNHQIFVNIYKDGRLERQAVLDANRPRIEHYTGDTQGRMAVLGAFVVTGVEHILIGPDHLPFLLGLLLLSGTLWRLTGIVTAFALGHSITLSLAALDWLRQSPAIVEPLIALGVVVVGVDNLLVHQRRISAPGSAKSADLRPWLVVVFGLIHGFGFGFAAVLREIGLPQGAVAWSLAGFNAGVELGQLAIVAVAIGDSLTKAVNGIPNVDRIITGHSDTLAWQDLVDYAEFKSLLLLHARVSLAASKSNEQAATDLSLPDKFSGYALTGRGGPAAHFATL